MRKIIVLAVVLLLIGCGAKPDPYPISDKQYKKGTDGLVYKFLPNGPPDKIFEGTPFEIASEIWNKGAYPVTEGYATAILENAYMCVQSGDGCVQVVDDGYYRSLLRENRDKIDQQIKSLELTEGLDPNHYADLKEQLRKVEEQIAEEDAKALNFNEEITKPITRSNTGDGPLFGRRLQSPEGNANQVLFRVKANKLDALAVQHTSPVILTTCYKYMTELATDICIDPDASATGLGPKACQMKDPTFTDQGAPVAITKIETRVLSDNDYSKPQFMIYIKNANKGEIIAENKLKQACSAAKLGYSDIGIVRLSDFRFGEYSYSNSTEGNMECKPNPLRLRQGTDDYIRCYIKESVRGISKTTPAYTSQVYVNLSYGYMQSISKQVVIEKAR